MKRPAAMKIPSVEDHSDVLAATDRVNELASHERDLEGRLAEAHKQRAGRSKAALEKAAYALLGGQAPPDEAAQEDTDQLASDLEVACRAQDLAFQRLDRARDEVSRELGASFQPTYNEVLTRFAKLLVELGGVAAEAEQVRRLAEGGGISFQRRDLSSYRTDQPGTRSTLLLDDLADRLGVEVPEGRATGQEPQGRRVIA